MNKPQKILRENLKRANKKGYIMHDSIYMKSIYRKDKTRKTENTPVVDRGMVWGRGNQFELFFS